MASRLIGRLIRNLATMENSNEAWSGFRDKLVPSFSDSERDFHLLDKSSITKLVEQEEKGRIKEVFPYNPRKTT